MVSFQSILEQDKERFLSLLSKNTSVLPTVREVENEFDRMLYTFNNGDESDAVKEAAAHMISTAKNATAFLDTSGEATFWKRTKVGDQPEKGRRSPLFAIWLVLSILCAGGAAGFWYYLHQADPDPLQLWMPIGAVLLAALFGIFAGIASHRKAPEDRSELQAEVAVDIQKVYRAVLSAALIIDKNLDDIRTSERIQARKELNERKEAVDKAELELFAHLLEAAYATKEEEASAEMISQIKFYLHRHQIETTDYSEENARWFDMIPAYEKGTLRPAFTTEGVLLKKGLASHGE